MDDANAASVDFIVLFQVFRDKMRNCDHALAPRNRGIIKPLGGIVVNIIWRMTGRHKMRRRSLTRFETTPRRGARARVNDIDTVLGDQTAQAEDVHIHDKRIFAVDWHVDMAGAGARKLRHAHTAIGNDDCSRTRFFQFGGNIDTALLGPARTKVGDDLHNNGWFGGWLRGHAGIVSRFRLLIFAEWFSTLWPVSPNPQDPSAPLPPPEKLINPRGQALAYRYQPGRADLPTVIYLHGYASDMQATKAQYLASFCADRDQSYLRFDYSGNGASEGVFAHGTIGDWTQDALHIIDTITPAPFILVGSSMGGWIGLHCAVQRPARIQAFVGIAAAPDFTEEIWLNRLDDAGRAACRASGAYSLPSSLGEPLVLSDILIQDGRNHLLLDKSINLRIPVTLLQGRQDAEVPWETAFKIKDKITPAVAEVVIVEDGDHRLARPQDLEILGRTVATLSARLSA